MDLIINFYKELDTLNLIIFWGIIIIIILLLIFSFILINKNKKLKRIVEQSNKIEDDIPIINEQIEKKQEAEEVKNIIPKTEVQEEVEIKQEEQMSLIEIEDKFIAEDHVLDYNHNIQQTPQQLNNYNEKKYKEIEIPNKPYQRNVLREMSLSQTSPIGINSKIHKENKKNEMVKDLEESLNIERANELQENQIINEVDLSNNHSIEEFDNIKMNSYKQEEQSSTNYLEDNYNTELSSDIPKTTDNNQVNSNENYLEEVSKKLSEAEIIDDIERTDYELQQEEDAIISYAELMEKKDTIQTIDEEDAIISIEELMNRTNMQNQEEIKKEQKLYNLSEQEENENFIKELKQFRNDL